MPPEDSAARGAGQDGLRPPSSWRSLLVDFAELYPFQPATALWRAFEISSVLRADLPSGFGLDLGCGDGKLTGLVAERRGGWRLVGLDPDPAEVELAARTGLYERLHCAGGDRIPEPDGAFDFVFSNSVLEHIAEVGPVLAEAARVLRSGGRFVFTVPSGEFQDCLAGPPLLWRLLLREGREAYLAEFDRRIAHLYYWSDARWTEELARAGFSRVSVTPCVGRAAMRRFESVANATSGLLYKLFGGRRRPIEIQRRLGVRGVRRIPRFMAAALAAVLGAGLSDPDATGGGGVRLIQAWK
jgi:SAM-dependent methyltransferase